ncbi:sensor histidine kinase [Shewanella violacea]|uniref:histidine kinase n=1 Tax=Shewanella violacea (strain JCM 10179 / CIP 106290 / LMG 19151 / DSS12) TaxID=637905 RepID=D4ZEZ7_SHEVD|nr:HAMP domain-containing sensor histidine kinase [Shewanella violacea]BAJ00377.1 sensor histidine kinase [Shewanella violacea DSS12]
MKVPKLGNSTAQSLTKKLSLYFNGIALLIGILFFAFSQAGLYWLEDEINKRVLQQTADYAISQFQQGARSPLIIGPNILAYDSAEAFPEKFLPLTLYPVGYNDEVTDDIAHDLFFHYSSFDLDGETSPLFLTLAADKIELSSDDWRYINFASLAIMILLYLAFDFAISKLSKRLVQPVNQLSQQLKSAQRKTSFSVPEGSALEFTELSNSLNKYRNQSELLIQQEQSFAKYASHELRTPLTVILGATKLLDKSAEPDFQLRQRDRIAKAATNMQHTIEALLSLVKQEQTRENSSSRKLTESEIKLILEEVSPLAKYKHLKVELKIFAEPEIQPSAPVLRMLLINLLQNAINASDSGVITLEIWDTCIKVLDQGRGLNDAEQSKDGHGLGLLIVDALCKRYGWQLSLTAGEFSGCIAQLDFACHEDESSS